ncbi:hypothetical protein V1511DRAFT_247266 [Dipodascopsis uninucleata]
MASPYSKSVQQSRQHSREASPSEATFSDTSTNTLHGGLEDHHDHDHDHELESRTGRILNGTGGPKRVRELSPEPDEETRLLIPADEPAVDPDQRFWVRTIRRATKFFLAFAVALYLLYFLSIFFTIPGFETRGGNFLMLFNLLISIGNLSVSLFTFKLPSKSQRVVTYLMVVFFLINFIIVMSTTRLRHYEGSVTGILIMLWALFTIGWIVFCDHVVERSRLSLEEQFVGHSLHFSRVRRSWRQWCSVMWTLILFIILLVLIVLITLSLIVSAYDSRIAPAGTMVEIDDGQFSVHIYCSRPFDDSGDPTILLEAGSTTSETIVNEWLEKTTKDEGSMLYDYRYCYWDRPGYAFSDNAPSPLSAGMTVDILSDALAYTGNYGPYILVSHGVGGIYSRIFASRHASDVEGIVLVDTMHEDYFISHVGNPARGFGYFLRGMIAPLGIEKQIGWIFRGRTSADRIYGRAFGQSGHVSLARMQEQIAARPFTRREIGVAREILPDDMPVAVITSVQMAENVKSWAEQQRKLATGWVSNTTIGEWTMVNSPHEVWRSDKGKEEIAKAVSMIAARNRGHKVMETHFQTSK